MIGARSQKNESYFTYQVIFTSIFPLLLSTIILLQNLPIQIPSLNHLLKTPIILLHPLPSTPSHRNITMKLGRPERTPLSKLRPSRQPSLKALPPQSQLIPTPSLDSPLTNKNRKLSIRHG